MNTHSTKTAAASMQPRFPAVVWQKGRGYIFRSAANKYKAELQALALGVAPVRRTFPARQLRSR
jgi:hypothetical protein